MTNVNSKTYRLQIFDTLLTESEFGMPIIPKYKGGVHSIIKQAIPTRITLVGIACSANGFFGYRVCEFDFFTTTSLVCRSSLLLVCRLRQCRCAQCKAGCVACR